MKHLFLTLTCLCTLTAADPYETGKTLYFGLGCAGCHGTRAEGTGSYPSLANRAEGFLAFKLRNFRDGKVQNARQEMMVGFAQGLDGAKIDALAHFLHHFRDETGERYDPAYETWGDGGS